MNITNDIITAYIDTFYENDNKDLKELRKIRRGAQSSDNTEGYGGSAAKSFKDKKA